MELKEKCKKIIERFKNEYEVKANNIICVTESNNTTFIIDSFSFSISNELIDYFTVEDTADKLFIQYRRFILKLYFGKEMW